MTGATHWARVVAHTFAPGREQLIAQALQAIEAKYDSPQDIALLEMIRDAHARTAGTERLPLPPLEEALASERARLQSMTTEEILAERTEGERRLRELSEEAKAKSAAEELRIRTIYGKTPNSQEDLP